MLRLSAWRARPTLIRFLLCALSLPGALRAHRRDTLTARHLELWRGPAIVEVREGHARQGPANRPFDGAQIGFFIGRDERKRIACHLRATGAADAVNVIVWHRGYVEVDDVTQ